MKSTGTYFDDMFVQQNTKKSDTNLIPLPFDSNLLESLKPKSTNSLPDYLNSLQYPRCDILNHQTQPLSMVCIDEACSDRTLICALCQAENHYCHACLPLKVYLNQVFGHLYKDNTGQNQHMPQKLNQVQQQNFSGKKIKNKQKNRTKNRQQIFQPKLPSQPRNKIEGSSSHILQHRLKIQQEKKQLLGRISDYRENILQKLHYLETQTISYYNRMVQQSCMLQKLSNPVQNIQKLINNTTFHHQKYENCAIDQKQRLVHKSQQKYQITKLKSYIKNILKMTNIQNKFSIQQKMQVLYSQILKVGKKIQGDFNLMQKQHEAKLEQIRQILSKQSRQIQKSIINKGKMNQFRFSQKLKGHKFVLKSQNKIAEQSGMQSSGQRFILLEPSLSTSGKGSKTNIWGIKIIKISGWVGVGIGLKYSLSKANYHFNYTNIGHGSYLISNNGYSWSHSVKDFNSAYKCFNYVNGDTVYIQYDPSQKKVQFFKNQNVQKFQLDVADPPLNDEYCPCVNMCSTGDSVEVINQKPSFL